MKSLLATLVVWSILIELSRCGPISDENIFKKIPSKRKIEEDSTITEEEREFVREIEAKFNIKNEENTVQQQPNFDSKQQRPLPAIIAIEIVNDNSTDGKGKRTIDANLGYGYKTSNGYFYQHFGQPKPEERGKFMIYPYSQHDIPPYHGPQKPYKYHTKIAYQNKNKGQRYHVEIQPSKAYELVPLDEDNSYKPDGIVSHINNQYEHVQAIQPPPPYPYQKDVTTLYSTLNGGQLSGLTGHFPVVMPNYFVSPSQFLNHYPGLEVPNQQKSIIPVIILRIPSSQIQHPTAEVFPKVTHDSPLNNINLQAIVDQYLASIRPQYQEPVYQQPYYVMMPNVVQYQHYNQEQHQQPIQYVNPIYVPDPKEVHPVYEDENLPFSENYPDAHHTQVIYAPHTAGAQSQVNHIDQYQTEEEEGQDEQEVHENEQENASPTPPPFNYHAHPFPKRQVKEVKPSDESKKNSRRLRSGAQETSI